jgi:hypothetical protein
MPKGVYKHEQRIGETNGAIEKFLGRKPKSVAEYKHIWHILFKKDKEEMKRQRQRHLNHTGPASIARGQCIFCETEKSVWKKKG